YCGREQPSEPARCISCGAPLPVPEPIQARTTLVYEPSPASAPVTPSEPLVNADQLKEGLAAAGAVAGSLGIGTIVLRVAAQGFAIAVASFIVGITAGSAAAGLNHYIPHLLTALLGGVLLGVVVTLVKKRSIWTLLAAPAGTILGSLVARLLPISSQNLPFSALLALAGGLLLSVLGGNRTRGTRIPCLKVLQPVAGAIGGLFFGWLGFVVMYRIY
ncbi:MAG TPA: hypothetical protein PK883_09030, partial [Anaerolineaceae bacterium]|nr:hypothetical protein [Anaerolineaceae bacterium]